MNCRTLGSWSTVPAVVLEEESRRRIRQARAENEALDNILKRSKATKRTAVYSGAKAKRPRLCEGGKVGTLKEMCIVALKTNVKAENLKNCSNLDFQILKPILENASPETLTQIENTNPGIKTSTDQLWERFCRKSFPKEERRENGSWRQLYARCLDEREDKFNRLTQKIREKMEKKKLGQRQTKLAYVDATPKPPLNALRAQDRNRRTQTANRTTTTQHKKNPHVPQAGRPSSANNPSSRKKKTKPAPLMAKALKMAKN